MKQKVQRFWTVSAVILLLVAGVANTSAQVASGSIGGLVTDPSRAAIAGAKLTLLNRGTGVERITRSDGTGNYQFPLVSPGMYKLRAEVPGTFHALPTNAYAMYAPDIRALSDEWRVTITDAPTTLITHHTRRQPRL